MCQVIQEHSDQYTNTMLYETSILTSLYKEESIETSSVKMAVWFILVSHSMGGEYGSSRVGAGWG